MGPVKGRRPETSLKPLKRKAKAHRFAVYDLETTTDLRNVYLCGFYDGEVYRYFESKPLPPSAPGSAVDKFLTWLLGNRLHIGSRIYAHNGGNFDAIYLLDWFRKHAGVYRVSLTPIQSSILMLEASLPDDEKVSWQFLDSAKLISAPLETLATKFLCLPKGKLEVDYETLHENPLRYDYLRKDCEILFHSIAKVYELIHSLGGEVGLTAPSTAMLLFRKRFLSSWLEINRHHGGCKCSH